MLETKIENAANKNWNYREQIEIDVNKLNLPWTKIEIAMTKLKSLWTFVPPYFWDRPIWILDKMTLNKFARETKNVWKCKTCIPVLHVWERMWKS